MTQFEMVEHVGKRAAQIARFNNCMVDITGLDDPIMMAKRELMMGKSPLILRRKVGYERDKVTGLYVEAYEYWDVNKMKFAIEWPEVL